MADARSVARSVAFQWRKLYGLPPSDPRAASIDEGEMLDDLLAHAITAEAERAALDPAKASVERQIQDGTFDERLNKAEQAFASWFRSSQRPAPKAGVEFQRPKAKVGL